MCLKAMAPMGPFNGTYQYHAILFFSSRVLTPVIALNGNRHSSTNKYAPCWKPKISLLPQELLGNLSCEELRQDIRLLFN